MVHPLRFLLAPKREPTSLGDSPLATYARKPETRRAVETGNESETERGRGRVSGGASFRERKRRLRWARPYLPRGTGPAGAADCLSAIAVEILDPAATGAVSSSALRALRERFTGERRDTGRLSHPATMGDIGVCGTIIGAPGGRQWPAADGVSGAGR